MGWLNAAASIIGGIYANKQAKKAVGAATDQANMAYQQSLPQQYTGMFGGYDPETGEFLNQDMQNLMQQYMDRRGQTAAQIQDLDPMELQQQLYNQQLGLLQPEQERQSLAQESRLLQQGRLGSTGGAGQMQALQEAQGQQRLGLLSNSYQQAQATQDAMRQREMQDLATMMQIGSMPGQYANQSMNFAKLRGANAWNKANMISGAVTNKAGANILMASNAVSNFGNQDFSNFSNPFAGLFSRPAYTPTPFTPGASMGNIHGGKY
jgi:hypothetical protein